MVLILNYEIFIRGENQPTIAFEEYIFLEEFAIIAGLNTIEITILENDYFQVELAEDQTLII